MSDITKHDGKEEGERNDSEKSRINLLVLGNTVAVHDSLETFGKLVGPVECRWCPVRPQFVKDRWNARPRLFLYRQ